MQCVHVLGNREINATEKLLSHTGWQASWMLTNKYRLAPCLESSPPDLHSVTAAERGMAFSYLRISVTCAAEEHGAHLARAKPAPRGFVVALEDSVENGEQEGGVSGDGQLPLVPLEQPRC